MNKKVVIIVVVVLLIAVIGTAAYFITSAPAPAPASTAKPAPAPMPAGQPSPDNAIVLAQSQYTFFKDRDIGGNDIRCIENPTDFESCRVECNKDPNCKAYNHVYDNGVWGSGKWGCCLKTPNIPPTASFAKIDYFLKKETAASTVAMPAPTTNVNSTVTGGRKPCDIYNDSSVGISQDCYRQLWREVGCGGDPFLIPDKANWNSDKNLATLKGDVKTWYEYANNRNSSYHKQFCKAAGEPFSFNTPQYLRHLQNKNYLL